MKEKVLILGATGMLGSAFLKVGARNIAYDVVGAVRKPEQIALLPTELQHRVRSGFDATKEQSLWELLHAEKPDVVINAVGVIKQYEAAESVLLTVPINTVFPHVLADYCDTACTRVIQISTDCVFSGEEGGYREDDHANARDVYGLSKYLGELRNAPHVTLRTSIIGPELRKSGEIGLSLLDWFLGQTGTVKGFRGAVFSGLPTNELARVVYDFVLPKPELTGVWHVSAEPINKFDLLNLIREIYEKRIDINPVDEPKIDRSLNSDRFRAATGYQPPDWKQLITEMRFS